MRVSPQCTHAKFLSLQTASAFFLLHFLYLLHFLPPGLPSRAFFHFLVQQVYQRAGRPASEVDSELVAQYVEKSLLTDEAAIRDICVSHPTAARRILNWLDGILAKMGNQKAQERAAEREFLETARSFYRRGLAEVNAAENVKKQTSTENVNIPGQETGPAVENAASERASAQERTAGEETAAEQADGDYFADLVENGYDAAQEQAQQRTVQEMQQATQETEKERRKRESYKDVPGLRWKSVAPARVDELLRTGLAELDGQQGFGNDGEVADAWRCGGRRKQFRKQKLL